MTYRAHHADLGHEDKPPLIPAHVQVTRLIPTNALIVTSRYPVANSPCKANIALQSADERDMTEKAKAS